MCSTKQKSGLKTVNKNNKNKGYMLVHEWIRHAITPIILSIFEENQTVFHIILFSMFRVWCFGANSVWQISSTPPTRCVSSKFLVAWQILVGVTFAENNNGLNSKLPWFEQILFRYTCLTYNPFFSIINSFDNVTRKIKWEYYNSCT